MDSRTPSNALTKIQRDEAGIFMDRAERLIDEALGQIGNSFALDTARAFLSLGFWWANFHIRSFT